MNFVNPHITFNGNCEEAFNFYKSIFGGEFKVLSRFKDMPDMPECVVADEDKERIMHIALPISKKTILMGNDTHGIFKESYVSGNNFSLSLMTGSREELDKLFSALGQGGEILVPLHDTFFGMYFGMVKDKFGVTWFLTFEENNRYTS